MIKVREGEKEKTWGGRGEKLGPDNSGASWVLSIRNGTDRTGAKTRNFLANFLQDRGSRVFVFYGAEPGSSGRISERQRKK